MVSHKSRQVQERLNRTSVGLKLVWTRGFGRDRGLPQSNQRGIETFNLSGLFFEMDDASIEPAWD